MAFVMPAAEVADAAAGKAAATAAGKKTAAKKTAPAAKKTAAAPAAKKTAAPAKKAPPLVATEKRTKPLVTVPHAGKFLLSGNIRLLTAEYIACVVVLGAGTLVAPLGSKDGTVRAMVKFTALSMVFFLLALVGSAGKGAARGATALGALITAAYLFTSSDVHDVAAWVAEFFTLAGDVTKLQPGGSGPVGLTGAQSGAGSIPAPGSAPAPGPANGQTPSVPGTLAPGGFGQAGGFGELGGGGVIEE